MSNAPNPRLADDHYMVVTGPASLHSFPCRSTATAADAEEALAPAPAAQLSALFARLPDMNNLDAIDRAAVEFTFLNSKAARRRLVKVSIEEAGLYLRHLDAD